MSKHTPPERRPLKLKPKKSKREFQDELSKLAREFSQWIELSVTSFPADPAEKKKRLAAIRKKDGFRTFMETYLPHYVRGDDILFNQAIF